MLGSRRPTQQPKPQRKMSSPLKKSEERSGEHRPQPCPAAVQKQSPNVACGMLTQRNVSHNPIKFEKEYATHKQTNAEHIGAAMVSSRGPIQSQRGNPLPQKTSNTQHKSSASNLRSSSRTHRAHQNSYQQLTTPRNLQSR